MSMSDRLNGMSSPVTRWTRNAVAIFLLPYMLWLFLTGREPGLLVSSGMLTLLLLAIAVRAGREKRLH
jgi:hypothetical protein